MDNGASSYRRFLEGDDNGFVEITSFGRMAESGKRSKTNSRG